MSQLHVSFVQALFDEPISASLAPVHFASHDLPDFARISRLSWRRRHFPSTLQTQQITPLNYPQVAYQLLLFVRHKCRPLGVLIIRAPL
jgi:hypothetical protein